MKKRILSFALMMVIVIMLIFVLSGCETISYSESASSSSNVTVSSHDEAEDEFEFIPVDNQDYGFSRLDYFTGITYNDLLRFTDSYQSSKVFFSNCFVTQIEDSKLFYIKSGEKIILIQRSNNDEPNVLVGDMVTVYGSFAGISQATDDKGNKYQIPMITVDRLVQNRYLPKDTEDFARGLIDVLSITDYTKGKSEYLYGSTVKLACTVDWAGDVYLIYATTADGTSTPFVDGYTNKIHFNGLNFADYGIEIPTLDDDDLQGRAIWITGSIFNLDAKEYSGIVRVHINVENIEYKNPSAMASHFAMKNQFEMYGYEYVINDDGSVTLGKYLGTDIHVTIPSEIDGHPVVTIGYDAFRGHSSLVSVVIPEGVKFVSGFIGCKSLSSVILPNSLSEIGGNAFEKCESLTSIVIPDNTEHIRYRAFYGCKNLEAITFPARLKSIGEDAFDLCLLTMESFVFPNSFEEGDSIDIDRDAFGLTLNRELNNKEITIHDFFRQSTEQRDTATTNHGDSSIQLLFDGQPISRFSNYTLTDLLADFGAPSDVSEDFYGGYNHYYIYYGFYFEVNAANVIAVKGNPLMFEVDGITLDKNRGRLIDILGVPSSEGWDEHDDDYYMMYESSANTIYIVMLNPNENPIRIEIWFN
ncbi:MAG: leucine-rich repeat domain-containing protein [Oscillospiraceae bacterium]|nr:leucine-rich repeat domain-containing protein [Oscillospiraceae bacterium]